jgi:hypothetical protein
VAYLGDNVGDRRVVDAIPVAGSEALLAVDVADKVNIGIAPGDVASLVDGVSAIVWKLIENPVLEIRRAGVD